MDCVDKANTANKKLVQARLPFKRLNPVPKETGQPKRTRTASSAPPTHEPSASDGENDDVASAPLQTKPTLVNGRGPLDGYMRRTKDSPVSSASVIDLTEDSNSTDVKTQPSTPMDALCPSTGNAAKNTQNVTETKEPEAAPAVPVSSEETMEIDEAEDCVAAPQLDSTMESETETEQNQNQEQETEEGQENESLLSTSSVSLVESSPEPSKSAPATPTTVPRTNTEQKQLKRRSLKSGQELEEKQRQREEKERQKREARAAKEKQREEARRLKEEMKKEKQEKKEKEERERREKREKHDKEKAERQQAKEEQRKVKIEAKLEEKRKKEEEKRLKEEKERIKAEKAEITRFLQKPKPQLAPKTLASVCGKFAPFEIKEHMALAPLTRVQCEEAILEELDRYLTEPDGTLDCLKDWITRKPRKSGPTKPKHTEMQSLESETPPAVIVRGKSDPKSAWLSSSVRDCVVVDDGPKTGVPDHELYGRMKLLQFHENYRPAYWGTWSKKSRHISPRCPFKLDKDLLDYEVDSDEEWEEEEPGESLSHSEGDDDDEGGDDDDEDDGFFVPHGYLSDGEGALEDEEGGDPEKQKVRQKLKAREWDELMAKRKLKVLEAVVKGCMWEGEDPPLDMLQPYAVCLMEPLNSEEPNTPEENASRQQRNDQWLSQLLPLLHGNVNSSKVIITEFQEFCRQQMFSPAGSPQSSADHIPPRIQVKRLMKENAVYEKRSTCRRCCWYVHPDVLARFGQEALPVPCQWTYLTSGAHTARDESTLGSQGGSPAAAHSASTTPSTKRKSGSNQSITKYMKRCGEPERAEAMETDGFQADTEDEDDDDCIILCEQSGSSEQNGQIPRTETKNTEAMDTLLSLPCPTPATA
ncbi:chromatin assembly factor 1 subunit A isoform X4 [Neoarius graeffei]|nr:chromatin assembly factor 1 subunit A isoform X4 [Neoarius graeffei]XP_060797454.1 chromatin assembly factor 1 subunit A isoform X4 [Neoarius graeffei]XP_060797455.1 chromatin assembly factor 1 subunit A isoform X4 [Neoarius graeffei]